MTYLYCLSFQNFDHALLVFGPPALPGSRAGSRSSERGSPSSLAILHCCTLLINWCQQWSHKNQSHRRHSRAGAGPSAAQPLKTGHIHRVTWSLYSQVKHPPVAVLMEVCDLHRLVVKDEGLVQAHPDFISSLCDLGNAQGGRFTGLTSQTILQLCQSRTSRLAQGLDLSLRLGRPS